MNERKKEKKKKKKEEKKEQGIINWLIKNIIKKPYLKFLHHSNYLWLLLFLPLPLQKFGS